MTSTRHTIQILDTKIDAILFCLFVLSLKSNSSLLLLLLMWLRCCRCCGQRAECGERWLKWCGVWRMRNDIGKCCRRQWRSWAAVTTGVYERFCFHWHVTTGAGVQTGQHEHEATESRCARCLQDLVHTAQLILSFKSIKQRWVNRNDRN